MALVGVELETLVFEPDAQTTRPYLVKFSISAFKKCQNFDFIFINIIKVILLLWFYVFYV